jgi:hypothetical protein
MADPDPFDPLPDRTDRLVLGLALVLAVTVLAIGGVVLIVAVLT